MVLKPAFAILAPGATGQALDVSPVLSAREPAVMAAALPPLVVAATLSIKPVDGPVPVPVPGAVRVPMPAVLAQLASLAASPPMAVEPAPVVATATGTGAIDASRTGGLQLGALPSALGFRDELQVDTGAFASIKAPKGFVPSLDIASALALGVETSLELAVADAALRGASARTRIATGALLPKLDLRRADGRGTYVATGINFSTNNRSESSLDFRLPLFFPAGWTELRRQNALESAAELERDAKKSLAALDNGLAFLAILSTQARLNLTVDYEKSLRELFEYTRTRAAGGLSTQTESNRVESRIVGVEADLSETRANLRGALSNYVRLTEHLPSTLSFRNPLPPLPSGVTDLQIIELIQDNPELLATRKRIDSHREEIRAGRSNFLPRLDFQASRVKTENVGATAGQQMETKAIVVMTLPLLAGGADMAAIAEANAKLDEQTLRSHLLERQLRSEVETTLAGLNTLGARYSATAKQVKLDTGVIDSFMDQLKLGNRPLLDVLDAQQRLYQSRQQLLLTGITQAQAFLRLSYLTGRLAGSAVTER